MPTSPFSVIILAAGKGTRMKSPLPKVLHPVAGSPMIKRIVTVVQGAGAQEVRVVVGVGQSMVRSILEPMGALCFHQTQQLGTGHAVLSAQPETLSGTVVVLNGDHPLIEVADLQKIIHEYHQSSADLALVSVEKSDPGEYGRVVRHQGQVRAVVEAQDATHESRKIKEINAGIYITRAEVLHEYLSRIQPHNAQGEFYLTDIVAMAHEDQLRVTAILAPDHVAQGVNSQKELALASQVLFERKIEALMEAGVIVIAPEHTYVESDVQVGEGSVLYPNVYLKGSSVLGARVVVESHAVIKDSHLGHGVIVKAGCYLEQTRVADRTEIGPYAHLRPGTELGEDCKIGNFVEMKKVKFGDRSKASHLSYLGDATVGKDTNIGCGTITCNYAVDKKKYHTQIGDHVFVGSDTQLVAPVTIGDHAVIGSGSTITKDVPDRALAVARGRQFMKENYVSPSLESSVPSEEGAS